MNIFGEIGILISWESFYTCSQPLRLSPSDFNCVVSLMEALDFPSLTILAIRFAHSGIPVIQWFVDGPAMVATISPSALQIISFECVAPLQKRTKEIQIC